MAYYSNLMSRVPQSRLQVFFSNLSKSQRTKNIDEKNRGIETEDEEPNIQDKNLQLLQLVIESQVQADHPEFLLNLIGVHEQ